LGIIDLPWKSQALEAHNSLLSIAIDPASGHWSLTDARSHATCVPVLRHAFAHFNYSLGGAHAMSSVKPLHSTQPLTILKSSAKFTGEENNGIEDTSSVSRPAFF